MGRAETESRAAAETEDETEGAAAGVAEAVEAEAATAEESEARSEDETAAEEEAAQGTEPLAKRVESYLAKWAYAAGSKRPLPPLPADLRPHMSPEALRAIDAASGKPEPKPTRTPKPPSLAPYEARLEGLAEAVADEIAETPQEREALLQRIQAKSRARGEAKAIEDRYDDLVEAVGEKGYDVAGSTEELVEKLRSYGANFEGATGALRLANFATWVATLPAKDGQAAAPEIRASLKAKDEEIADVKRERAAQLIEDGAATTGAGLKAAGGRRVTTYEQLQKMSPAELAKLSPEEIAAITQRAIAGS